MDETGTNDKFRTEIDKAKGKQIGGGVLLLIGVPSTIVGIALAAVGSNKLARARRFEHVWVDIQPLPRGAGISWRGHF